jgi:hypothetical protein
VPALPVYLFACSFPRLDPIPLRGMVLSIATVSHSLARYCCSSISAGSFQSSTAQRLPSIEGSCIACSPLPIGYFHPPPDSSSWNNCRPPSCSPFHCWRPNKGALLIERPIASIGVARAALAADITGQVMGGGAPIAQDTVVVSQCREPAKRVYDGAVLEIIKEIPTNDRNLQRCFHTPGSFLLRTTL